VFTSPESHGLAFKARLSPSSDLPPHPGVASLAAILQLAENSATLSPAFATLTCRVRHKSFACHSYKKSPGVRTPLLRRSLASKRSHSLRTSRSFFSYSYELFCTAQNSNSNALSIFHTLSQKHPGWGIHRTQPPHFHHRPLPPSSLFAIVTAARRDGLIQRGLLFGGRDVSE
jgi:hypothetical protein